MDGICFLYLALQQYLWEACVFAVLQDMLRFLRFKLALINPDNMQVSI